MTVFYSLNMQFTFCQIFAIFGIAQCMKFRVRCCIIRVDHMYKIEKWQKNAKSRCPKILRSSDAFWLCGSCKLQSNSQFWQTRASIQGFKSNQSRPNFDFFGLVGFKRETPHCLYIFRSLRAYLTSLRL